MKNKLENLNEKELKNMRLGCLEKARKMFVPIFVPMLLCAVSGVAGLICAAGLGTTHASALILCSISCLSFLTGVGARLKKFVLENKVKKIEKMLEEKQQAEIKEQLQKAPNYHNLKTDENKIVKVKLEELDNTKKLEETKSDDETLLLD